MSSLFTRNQSHNNNISLCNEPDNEIDNISRLFPKCKIRSSTSSSVSISSSGGSKNLENDELVTLVSDSNANNSVYFESSAKVVKTIKECDLKNFPLTHQLNSCNSPNNKIETSGRKNPFIPNMNEKNKGRGVVDIDFEPRSPYDENDSGHFDAGTGSNGSNFSETLTDSKKIELAGGKELFSCSKTRSNRRGNRGGSTNYDYDSHHLFSPVLLSNRRKKSCSPRFKKSNTPIWELQNEKRHSLRHRYSSYAYKHHHKTRARTLPDYYEPPPHRLVNSISHPITIKETVFGPEVRSIEKTIGLKNNDMAPRKKSVVYEGGYSPNNRGEIVFDDIEEWGQRDEKNCNLHNFEKRESPQVLTGSYKNWEEESEEKSKMSEKFEGEKSNTSPSGYESDETSPLSNKKIPESSCNKRLIGNLAIADYEGSPKRYGLHRTPPAAISMPNDLDLVDFSFSDTKNEVKTPSQTRLPGFPLRITQPASDGRGKIVENGIGRRGKNYEEKSRVVSKDNEMGGMRKENGLVENIRVFRKESERSGCSSNAVKPPDELTSYLYEFSETRKVLEDFFTRDERRDFDELDYSLRRQSGNSVVGQRLASELLNTGTTESPKKTRRNGREVVMSFEAYDSSPRLISFHELSRGPVSNSEAKNSGSEEGGRDVNDNEMMELGGSGGAGGETDLGLQSTRPRTYALSPDTTDCDSNEFESEMSLDYELSAHSSSRLPLQNPAISSGNLSDENESQLLSKEGEGEEEGESDSNPTLLLMKKQITEIEKEIQLRANVNPNITSTDIGNSGENANAGGKTEEVCSSMSSTNAKSHGAYERNTAAHFDSNSCNEVEIEGLLDPMRSTPPPSPAPISHLSSGPMPSVPNSIERKGIGGLNTECSSDPLKLPSAPPESLNTSDGLNSLRTRQLHALPKFDSASYTISHNGQNKHVTQTNTPPPPQNNLCNEDYGGEGGGSSSEEQLVHHDSPVWVPRRPLLRGEREQRSHLSIGTFGLREPFLRKRYQEIPDDDADTDQETDRLLGQHRTEDDYGFYNEKAEWKKTKLRSLLPSSSSQNKGLSSSSSCSYAKSNNSHIPSSHHHSLNITNPTTNSNNITNSTTNPTPTTSNITSTLLPHNNVSHSNNTNKQQSGISHLSNSPTTTDHSSILSPSDNSHLPPSKTSNLKDKEGVKKKRNKEDFMKNPSVLIEGVLFRARYLGSTQLISEGQPTKATRMLQAEEAVSRIKAKPHSEPTFGPNESGRKNSKKLNNSFSSSETSSDSSIEEKWEKNMKLDVNKSYRNESSRMSLLNSSMTTGTLYSLKYCGSVEVDGEICKKRLRTKREMIEEAILHLKAPDGETQPSTEVDLFISTEKIMVLNTDLKEIMMDHALRTISYIADIGDLVVLMARPRPLPLSPSEPPANEEGNGGGANRGARMICHVFESEEAQYIAQSIGQAFQVAYMEFLKANGIEDHSFVREMDYQEVLNSQEIFGDELKMFAKKELQKDVVVPKAKGEILGVVIVESGWGSMLPTVVIANLGPAGAAARCGQLNIGDQIIAINGVSLVGLPLSTCQTYIKNSKTQTVVKLTVVPCPPVVEVKIKRPDTKYQLGFSVQNGVICSLLRGGIAERGGVRVGHRIIEINNQSVVAVPHEKIVNLLATSVGEINMKTMPTSMFRLLTGQETPLYI